MLENSSPLVELAFQSFPPSRGNPTTQEYLMRGARHLVPDLPILPLEEFKTELSDRVRQYLGNRMSMHPTITAATLSAELNYTSGALHQAYVRGRETPLDDILTTVGALSILRDHDRIVGNNIDTWGGMGSRGVSMMREAILYPSAQPSPEDLVRIDHPVFRQLLALVGDQWRNPENQTRIRLLRPNIPDPEYMTGCDYTCPTIGDRFDHLVQTWEARNNQPFHPTTPQRIS